MFTQCAFIRKSSFELRKKLEGLGYRHDGASINENLCLFTDPKHGLYWVEFFSNISHPEDTNAVDCGTNEELFLAIAALRDDVNYNQWFTDGDGFWFWMEPLSIVVNLKPVHKATVEELIEHFKTE